MLRYICTFIATVGYVGYLPRAPGTWGSLVALPLYFLLPQPLFLMSIPLLFVLGWVATYILLKYDGSDRDPSYIVIDELYAMMAVFLVIPRRGGIVLSTFVGFVLFRFFDILKPWPISAVDRYFKQRGPLGASFGVMIDDFLAAALVYVLLSALVFLF